MGMSYRTAVIDVTGGAVDTLVTPPDGRQVRVHAFVVCGSADSVVAIFQTHDSATSISGRLRLAANGHHASAFTARGHFDTPAADPVLDISASAAGNVTGFVRYSIV